MARAGENPTVVGRVASGWVVLGDAQYPPGYSLLLPDPVVGSINDLQEPARGRFLSDMVAVGDALLAITNAYRINYEIQGNADQALHAHIFARYGTEEAEYRTGPVWRYDSALRQSKPFDPVAHDGLRRGLREWLETRGLLSSGKRA
jgi:diadenosine tetraphosphate (Ap4A) HIT family hydrolase